MFYLFQFWHLTPSTRFTLQREQISQSDLSAPFKNSLTMCDCFKHNTLGPMTHEISTKLSDGTIDITSLHICASNSAFNTVISVDLNANQNTVVCCFFSYHKTIT